MLRFSLSIDVIACYFYYNNGDQSSALLSFFSEPVIETRMERYASDLTLSFGFSYYFRGFGTG